MLSTAYRATAKQLFREGKKIVVGLVLGRVDVPLEESEFFGACVKNCIYVFFHVKIPILTKLTMNRHK